MKEESKELYHYTKNMFSKELEGINKDCISPLIEVRKVVKKSIEKYCIDYCSKNDNPFSENDFKETSNKIYLEIMAGEL